MSYQVLIVDDEKIIRDGIRSSIEWSKLGIDTVDTAMDGLEAYEKVVQSVPDIIITDIKMPELSGLELIRKLASEQRTIRFVVLSGYKDFEYAKQAMNFGVKHYLLKPTDAEEIEAVLTSVLREIEGENRKKAFMRTMEEQLEQAIPSLKEQFIRDCLLNRLYSKQEWEQFRSLLGLQEPTISLLVAQLEGAFDYLEVFALKNICEETFPGANIVLSTIIGNKFLLLLRRTDEEEAVRLAAEAKSVFTGYYRMDLTVWIDAGLQLEQLHTAYHEALQGLGYRFYLGEGSIITRGDTIAKPLQQTEGIGYDLQAVTASIRIGDTGKLHEEMGRFFDKLQTAKCDIRQAMSYCLELLAAVSRLHPADPHGKLQDIVAILQMNTLEEINAFALQFSAAVAEANFHTHRKKYSEVIQKMLELVEAHYQDEQFSLLMIAREKLFMNGDYLGKLFKKETGEYFSHYVLQYRIEKAKHFMNTDPGVKIYELAEKTGFGANAQYFIKMFKKTSGMTPGEYKRT